MKYHPPGDDHWAWVIFAGLIKLSFAVICMGLAVLTAIFASIFRAR
jgi:hypothetical protein